MHVLVIWNVKDKKMVMIVEDDGIRISLAF